jgi:hypothetical protein
LPGVVSPAQSCPAVTVTACALQDGNASGNPQSWASAAVSTAQSAPHVPGITGGVNVWTGGSRIVTESSAPPPFRNSWNTVAPRVVNSTWSPTSCAPAVKSTACVRIWPHVGAPAGTPQSTPTLHAPSTAVFLSRSDLTARTR